MLRAYLRRKEVKIVVLFVCLIVLFQVLNTPTKTRTWVESDVNPIPKVTPHEVTNSNTPNNKKHAESSASKDFEGRHDPTGVGEDLVSSPLPPVHVNLDPQIKALQDEIISLRQLLQQQQAAVEEAEAKAKEKENSKIEKTSDPESKLTITLNDAKNAGEDVSASTSPTPSIDTATGDEIKNAEYSEPPFASTNVQADATTKKPKPLINSFFRNQTALKPGTTASRICSQDQFFTEEYNRRVKEFKEKPRYHRKQWEYYYTYKALDDMEFIKPGSRGIVFGVEHEPLPALFASKGCFIVATDYLAQGSTLDQHNKRLADLNDRHICEADMYKKHVSFRVEDANSISADLHNKFDFVWTTSLVQSLGSIDHAQKFMINVMKVLKPGGVAVHTTDINLTDLGDTTHNSGAEFWRYWDLERALAKVTDAGFTVSHINYSSGNAEFDVQYDEPPFDKQEGHIKILVNDLVATSFTIIVRKPKKDVIKIKMF